MCTRMYMSRIPKAIDHDAYAKFEERAKVVSDFLRSKQFAASAYIYPSGERAGERS